VDGVEVDRAPGIWVDAASAVSCAFTHTFSSSGTHALAVAVADVVPGDDELSNNQATASIQVQALHSLRYHHEVTVESATWRSSSRQEGWYTQVSGNTRRRSEWLSDSDHVGWWQTVQFQGELPAEVSFPLTAFEVTHSSGGVAIPSTRLSGLTPVDESQCVGEVDPVSAGYLTLCAWEGRTLFTYTRYGGEVTYFSRWYQATWLTDTLTGTTSFSEWSSNTQYTLPTEAARWTEGSSYELDVQVIDGGTRYRATASVALTPYQERSDNPYSCTSYHSPGYSSETCRRSRSTTQGVRGAYVSSDP
jgi:hypothetical protein